MMRGHPATAADWLARAQQRVEVLAGKQTLLTQGHTYRCYAGPTNALLGRVEEGERHLSEYETFIRERTPRDAWRNAQVLTHRALFSQLSGAPDDVIERQFERLAQLRPNPKGYSLQQQHVFVAKGYRRCELARRPGAGAAQVRALLRAIEELSATRRHPTMRAHGLVIAGCAQSLTGRSPDAAWGEALRLARATQNPWVEFELTLMRAHHAQRSGDGAQAETLQREAQTLAKAGGWPLLERRAVRAFDASR